MLRYNFIMKQCTICATMTVKNPLKDWHKGPTCKRCYGRNKAKDNFKLNPEKINLKNKKWRDKNKVKVSSINKEWFSKNHHKVKIYNDNAKQYKADYYKAHKEEYREKHVRYYQLNKEEIINKQLNLRKQNPLLRLRHSLSSNVNKSLSKHSMKKSNKTMKIVGLSLIDFRTYLESYFDIQMTWNNYGKWEVDHTCPLSQAKSEDELYKLWNYTNLRPMWANLNKIKSDNKTKEAEEMCIELLNRGWL